LKILGRRSSGVKNSSDRPVTTLQVVFFPYIWQTDELSLTNQRDSYAKADIPTEQEKVLQSPWFPDAHAQEGRQDGVAAKAGQGTEAHRREITTRRMNARSAMMAWPHR
jgi:hypothetical protein